MQLSAPSVQQGVLDSDQGGVEVDVKCRQQHVPKWRLLSGREGREKGATSRFVQEHRFPFAVNVGFRLLDWRAFEQHRRHAGRSGNNNIKQVDLRFHQLHTKATGAVVRQPHKGLVIEVEVFDQFWPAEFSFALAPKHIVSSPGVLRFLPEEWMGIYMNCGHGDLKPDPV